MKTSRLLTHILSITFLTIMLAAITGCSSSSQPGLEGEGLAGDGAEFGLSEADLNAQRNARYGGGSIPLAEGEGVFRDVTFLYDSSSLDDSAMQSVEYNLEILKANPEVKIQLEGHCDERGTAEYNMALGNRRSQAVYDLLSSYGIDRSRVETISFGSEVPLDPGHGEAAYAKNRRVHFSAFRELPQ